MRPMSSHRVIWRITGVVVLVAAVVLVVRWGGRAWPGALPGTGRTGVQTLVDAMVAHLEQDHAMDRPETKAAVAAVARLTSEGTLSSAHGHYALGLHSYELRSFKAAEAEFRKAIALAPDWSWPYAGLGILLANHATDRRREAEEVFREAARLDPEWSRPYNDLAVLLRISGRLDEAEQMALKALQLAPDSVAAHNNYGNLLVTVRRFEEAEREYQNAIDLAPQHPKPYYNFACLCSLQGKREEALASLRQAIALDPALRVDARKDPDFKGFGEDADFLSLVRDDPSDP